MAFLVSSACVFMVQIRLTCPTPLTWPRRGGCTFQGLATSPAPRGKAHWMFRAKHREDGTEFFHSTNTSQGQRLPGPWGILCVAALRTINEWTCSQVDAGPADPEGPWSAPTRSPLGTTGMTPTLYPCAATTRYDCRPHRHGPWLSSCVGQHVTASLESSAVSVVWILWRKSVD